MPHSSSAASTLDLVGEGVAGARPQIGRAPTELFWHDAAVVRVGWCSAQ